ncbi:hypothetical protein KSS87_017360 [Heliosperma pusillum]|nr:hypothetical protein KSS87_017360 [Heliosperma pusillum]
MAGDVQQPFSLSFQMDALHSSSISFGRFELESLSWERRSSFSHNRYLEEVEKYAKPGSVTEKKAYFEAHFRKRALLRQASSESQAEGSESSSSSTISCEEVQKELIHVEEPQPTVENRDVYHFDESPKGSSDGDFRAFEYEAGLASNLHLESHTVSLSSIDDTNTFNEVDTRLKSSTLAGDLCDQEHDYDSMLTDRLELKQEPTPRTVFPVENVKWIDNVEAGESESACNQDSLLNVQQNVNLESESNDETADELKEQCISESTSEELINQPSKVDTVPRTLKSPDKTGSSGLRSRSGADVLINGNVEVKKGITRTNSWREIQSPLRSRAKKQISETITPSLQSSLRQLPKENPQNSKSDSPQTKRSEKEVRPRRAATPQPSTPERNESQRPRSAMSSTRQIASYRKEIGQSVMNSSFRCSGGAKKEVRQKRAATPQRSTPEMSELLRPRSAISSTRSITSYRKEGSQSVRNKSFRCYGGAEKSREKIMAAGTRKLSRKLDLNENPKLCPVSNTLSWVANREKVTLDALITWPRSEVEATFRLSGRHKRGMSEIIASNKSSAKASIRTLKPENQTRTGSKFCSTSIVKEAVFASKFAGSPIESSSDKGTDVYKINHTNSTVSTRNRVMEPNKRKEVVCTKEIVKDRKPKARQNGQIVEKFMEATKKAELGRSGHSFLRKSLGHSFVADYRSVSTTSTPKVGPRGNGNALFRKSIGHKPL